MPVLGRTLGWLAVIAVLAACSSRGRGQTDRFPPLGVQVENQNFSDVTVYLVWNSDRRRLGVVNGNTRSTFTTAWYGPAMHVELDMLAGSRYRGERISVSPGDQVVIEIPSSIERMRVYRRAP